MAGFGISSIETSNPIDEMSVLICIYIGLILLMQCEFEHNKAASYLFGTSNDTDLQEN
jgi:hypothetical protein